jgi:hypothetical protein
MLVPGMSMAATACPAQAPTVQGSRSADPLILVILCIGENLVLDNCSGRRRQGGTHTHKACVGVPARLELQLEAGDDAGRMDATPSPTNAWP